jgi:hypothetical protein
MWLLVIALFGLTVPNGIFLYWLFTEFTTMGAVFSDHLALGFILDCFLAVGLLAYYFARHPPGPVRWPWFVLLSFIGGLGFSLPTFWWLNERGARMSVRGRQP